MQVGVNENKIQRPVQNHIIDPDKFLDLFDLEEDPYATWNSCDNIKGTDFLLYTNTPIRPESYDFFYVQHSIELR